MLGLALDAGTTSARARCSDTGARVASEAATTPDGGAEPEPDAPLEAVAAAVGGCLGCRGPDAREIRAVDPTAPRPSLMAAGAAGAPLTPVFTWADTRSAGAGSTTPLSGPGSPERIGTRRNL